MTLRRTLLLAAVGVAAVLWLLLATHEWGVGTRADGTPLQYQACDILTLTDGKIAAKRSYRKVVASGRMANHGGDHGHFDR